MNNFCASQFRNDRRVWRLRPAESPVLSIGKYLFIISFQSCIYTRADVEWI